MIASRAHAPLFFSLVLLSPTAFAQPIRAEGAVRVAQASETAPPPEPAEPPVTPAPAPTPTPAAALAVAPATSMEGVHGEVSLGAARYLGTTAGTLVGGRITAQRWFDNFALVGGFHIATDGDDALAGGVSVGGRVLGSSTKSGPFAGVGVGLLHLTVRPPATGTTATVGTEDKFGGTAYAELGAIARGRWIIGARLDLPMFAVTDAKMGGVDRSGNVEYRRSIARPIGLGLEVGFIF